MRNSSLSLPYPLLPPACKLISQPIAYMCGLVWTGPELPIGDLLILHYSNYSTTLPLVKRTLLILAISLLSLVVLAGCASEPDPTAAPTSASDAGGRNPRRTSRLPLTRRWRRPSAVRLRHRPRFLPKNPPKSRLKSRPRNRQRRNRSRQLLPGPLTRRSPRPRRRQP